MSYSHVHLVLYVKIDRMFELIHFHVKLDSNSHKCGRSLVSDGVVILKTSWNRRKLFQDLIPEGRVVSEI